MNRATYAGRYVREPLARSIHDEEAEGPVCRECATEPVSDHGQVCAECLGETACPLCGSFACLDRECDESEGFDTAEEYRGER